MNGPQHAGRPGYGRPGDGARHEHARSVHVDCDGCAVRGAACGDCVISVLLGAPPEGVELDPAEQAALAALAGGGLVPPLRLVPTRPVRSEPAPPGWFDE